MDGRTFDKWVKEYNVIVKDVGFTEVYLNPGDDTKYRSLYCRCCGVYDKCDFWIEDKDRNYDVSVMNCRRRELYTGEGKEEVKEEVKVDIKEDTKPKGKKK